MPIRNYDGKCSNLILEKDIKTLGKGVLGC